MISSILQAPDMMTQETKVTLPKHVFLNTVDDFPLFEETLKEYQSVAGTWKDLLINKVKVTKISCTYQSVAGTWKVTAK